jgi:hypothetical protein
VRRAACGGVFRAIGVRAAHREAGWIRPGAYGLELKACSLRRGLQAEAGGADVERAACLCTVAPAW